MVFLDNNESTATVLLATANESVATTKLPSLMSEPPNVSVLSSQPTMANAMQAMGIIAFKFMFVQCIEWGEAYITFRDISPRKTFDKVR